MKPVMNGSTRLVQTRAEAAVMPELLILDVVCARPEAGSIEAGIRSVVSYDAYTRERGPVSTDDDDAMSCRAPLAELWQCQDWLPATPASVTRSMLTSSGGTLP
jgi:hypothetical protein